MFNSSAMFNVCETCCVPLHMGVVDTLQSILSTEVQYKTKTLCEYSLFTY